MNSYCIICVANRCVRNEYTKQSKHISTKYHFELNFREVVEVPLELKPEAELQRKLENFDTESE